MAVAHRPPVARGAIGLEDHSRMLAAPEPQRHLAARHEVRRALGDGQVARQAGAILREQGLRDLGRSELCGCAAGLDARYHELHRLVDVVVQHEVRRLGVARELASVGVHILLAIVLDDAQLVLCVAVGDAHRCGECHRLVAVVELNRQRVRLHAHAELLLVKVALDKIVDAAAGSGSSWCSVVIRRKRHRLAPRAEGGCQCRRTPLGRENPVALANLGLVCLAACLVLPPLVITPRRFATVNGGVDHEAALVLASILAETKALEHEGGGAWRRHLHRRRDRHGLLVARGARGARRVRIARRATLPRIVGLLLSRAPRRAHRARGARGARRVRLGAAAAREHTGHG
eukprot:scaffold38310_cov63-Phaeocystis_antarctica.AAC.1